MPKTPRSRNPRARTAVPTQVRTRPPTGRLKLPNRGPGEDEPESVLLGRALRESEERYRSIVAAMSEGIVLQNADGRIVECNGAAERILGLTHDQLMGLTSLDPRWAAVDANGQPLSGEDHPISVTLRTGEPQHDFVMGVQRGDGTRAWVCVNSQPLYRPGEDRPYSAVVSFADITAGRLAEAALSESEGLFRSIYEQSLDGIFLTAPDGRILAANPEACRMLGRTEEEICRLGRSGLVDITDPRFAPYIAERAAKGRARGELRLIRSDGTRFPIEVSSAIFRDREGQLLTSMSVRDISARVAAQEALREANEQLEARVAQRTRELAALLRIGREVASELELQPLLAHVLVELRSAIEYTGAAVGLLENGELVILDYAGPAPCEAIVGRHIDLSRDSGYRRVIDAQAPVIVDDIWADREASEGAWPIWDVTAGHCMRYARSWLGVPLLSKGKLIGLLRLDHAEPGRFTPEDAEHALAFAYQVAVAIANAQLHEAGQRAAAAAERQRLARELHDSVSQVLYAIVLGGHAARQRLAPDQAWLGSRLDYLVGLAETGMAEMRSLIFELRPELLAAGGLVSALGQHVDMLRARYGLHVQTDFAAEPQLSDAAKEALFRIAQEATNNAGKHAHAQHLSLRLLSDGGWVNLEITDDGRGFNTSLPYPGHMGLRSMQERAADVGGLWEIESSAGSGTRIRVRVPGSVPAIP